MNITLSLKPIYYKLIDKGLKTTEYRDLNEYYTKKLTKGDKVPEKGDTPDYKDIDTVTFLSGNAHDRPAMKFKVEKITLWPESKPSHYAIKLGERIKTKGEF